MESLAFSILQFLFLQLSAHYELGIPSVSSFLSLFISIPQTTWQQYWIQELKNITTTGRFGLVWNVQQILPSGMAVTQPRQHAVKGVYLNWITNVVSHRRMGFDYESCNEHHDSNWCRPSTTTPNATQWRTLSRAQKGTGSPPVNLVAYAVP